MAIENCGLPSGPRTIAVSWHSYLLVGLLAELQQAGVLRHHSTHIHIYISDSTQTVYELPLQPNDSASETFLHKSDAVRSAV